MIHKQDDDWVGKFNDYQQPKKPILTRLPKTSGLTTMEEKLFQAVLERDRLKEKVQKLEEANEFLKTIIKHLQEDKKDKSPF